MLRLIAVDWNLVWSECHRLAHDRAGATGCPTLDTLHVASARVLGFRQFVTADRRQAAAGAAGGPHGHQSVRVEPLKQRFFMLSIKRGEFTYDWLLAEAERRLAHIETLYDTSPLPPAPD